MREGDDVIERFEIKGLVVRIHQDRDAVDPRKDYDHLAHFVCWDRNYNIGDEHTRDVTLRDLVQRAHDRGEKVLAALPLRFWAERGGATFRAGDPVGDSDGACGWGYVTDAAAKRMGSPLGSRWEHDGETTVCDKAYFQRVIREEAKEYGAYLNGESYGYTVMGADGDVIDSCWGFTGDLEYVRQEARNAAEGSEDPADERKAKELAGRATFAGVSS